MVTREDEATIVEKATTRRRTLIAAMSAAGAALAGAGAIPVGPLARRAFAQPGDFPSRPIRWIVPYLAGTAPDMSVRVVAEALTDILRQPVVVENKGGASGNLGAQIAARAKPDGYTWVYSATPMATNMRMYKAPGYDTLKDFTHVCLIGGADVLLFAREGTGLRTVRDLVERLRREPGKLNFGSGGVGTPAHLGAELFLNVTGADAVHVPYKGASETVNALMGGQIDFAFPIFQVAFPHVQTGKLVALAVAGPQRNPALPNVPTLAEAGVAGVSLRSFGGVSLPAGAPAAIVKKIGDAVRQALERPATRAKMEAQGGSVRWSTPEQFVEEIRAEIERTEKMMRIAKLEPQ